MKYPKTYLIALFILSISCNKKMAPPTKNKTPTTTLKTHTSSKIAFNSDKKEVMLIEDEKEFIKPDSDSSILVSYLNKFHNQDDYYLELNFNSEYSDSLWAILDQSKSKIIYKEDEEERIAVPDSIIKAHFSTIGIDTLFLMNAKQKIFDTIYRNRFEFYDASIESYYIATYKLDKNYKDPIIAISSNRVISDLVKKSPVKQFQKSISKRNKNHIPKQYDDLFSSSTLIHETDTISIISTGLYADNEYSIYLIKNGEVKDTIINNYLAIRDIKPVPFSTQNELTYIYSAFKPETDTNWTGLLGIDIKNWKLNLLQTNRLER